MISPDQFLSGDESERPQPLAEESEDLLDSVRYQQQQQIQEAFVFKYGAAVFWGMTKEQEMEWMRLLARYATDPLYGEDVEVEEFSCVQRPDRTPKIFNDLIVLTGREDDGVKLAISLAIGQSVKLERFEWLVEDTLESSQHIPPSIAATGTSKMSRTDTVKAIGTLFNIRSDIYLRAQILNTPELFRMEQQQLLPLYSATRGYLEISQRVLILNQRLLVINDVLYLLHKHLTKTHGMRI
jgi:uncharacterized Rmd1/YagE family protein